MNARYARRVASCCQRSPGILCRSDPLPCTTSSWLIGSTDRSEKAYMRENVIWLWWYCRWIGSLATYSSESCVHPVFHFRPKPRPPRCVGRVTPGHAVDSSAIVTIPGTRLYAVALISWRNEMASRCSRPPYWLGAHSPSLRA
jgi:hypothetical protein